MELSKQDIIRAWKDEEYRNSLSAAERAQLPENPAGAVELPDDELEDAAGGTTSYLCVYSGFVTAREVFTYFLTCNYTQCCAY